MNKLKKSLVSLVSALMVAATVMPIAACGGGGNNTGNNGNSGSSIPEITEDQIKEIVAYDGSDVEISFYHTMGANLRAVLDKYIPKFNALYPKITIKHTMVGDYDSARDQIATEVTGGNTPSIAYCYPDHVALYNKAKVVLQLDHYIESEKTVTRADGTTDIMGLTDAQKADFVPAYYNEGRVYGDGFMYTLPFSKSTEVLYYNKTYFDKNGYTVPTTWDEMETLCATIKSKEGKNVTPLGYDSESNWFITMTEQLNTPYTTANGSDHFLFNTPENRAFVEKFTGWYQKGYVTTEEISGGYTSSLFTETAADKMKCYMCIGSSAGASYQCPELGSDGKYPFEVGVAMIPQANPADPAVIQQGPSVCLFKKSNPQEQAAAWLFAKYLTTSVEFQAQFSMTNGYTPVIKSAENNSVYADFLNKADGNAYLQATCVKQTIAQMNAYYISPAFEGSSAARDEVGMLMQTCFTKAPKDGAAAFIESAFNSTIDTLVYDYGY